MAELADDFGLDLQTTQDHRDLIARHDAKLRKRKRDLEKWDAYRRGDVPLKYMAPEIADKFGDRICQLIINVAEMGVRAYEERLDLDGVRLDPNQDADDKESEWWTRLDMDVVYPQVNDEMLGMGAAFTCVGVSDEGDNIPVVTAESPLQMTADVSPLRKTRSAVKRWYEDDRTPMRSLYLPNETLEWARGANGKWQLVDRIEHGWGRVPVYPFSNQAHLLDETGVPVFKVIIPIYEGLNKMATDMMVGGEFHALPRRWATNVAQNDFVNDDGETLTPLQQLIGAMWNVPGEPGAPDVRVGQFDASDLANFHNSIKLLFWAAGHLMGLPQSYTATATDNPAAEGAIKAGEIRLIKGAERINTRNRPSWRGTWQSVMQIRSGGTMPAEAKNLQIIERDAATPTFAQLADGTTKLVATKDGRGRSIVPIDMARKRLGFTSAERDEMARMDREDAQREMQAIRDQVTQQVAPGQPDPAEPDEVQPDEQ